MKYLEFCEQWPYKIIDFEGLNVRKNKLELIGSFTNNKMELIEIVQQPKT